MAIHKGNTARLRSLWEERIAAGKRGGLPLAAGDNPAALTLGADGEHDVTAADALRAGLPPEAATGSVDDAIEEDFGLSLLFNEADGSVVVAEVEDFSDDLAAAAAAPVAAPPEASATEVPPGEAHQQTHAERLACLGRVVKGIKGAGGRTRSAMAVKHAAIRLAFVNKQQAEQLEAAVTAGPQEGASVAKGEIARDRANELYDIFGASQAAVLDRCFNGEAFSSTANAMLLADCTLSTFVALLSIGLAIRGARDEKLDSLEDKLRVFGLPSVNLTKVGVGAASLGYIAKGGEHAQFVAHVAPAVMGSLGVVTGCYGIYSASTKLYQAGTVGDKYLSLVGAAGIANAQLKKTGEDYSIAACEADASGAKMLARANFKVLGKIATRRNDQWAQLGNAMLGTASGAVAIAVAAGACVPIVGWAVAGAAATGATAYVSYKGINRQLKKAQLQKYIDKGLKDLWGRDIPALLNTTGDWYRFQMAMLTYIAAQEAARNTAATDPEPDYRDVAMLGPEGDPKRGLGNVWMQILGGPSTDRAAQAETITAAGIGGLMKMMKGG